MMRSLSIFTERGLSMCSHVAGVAPEPVWLDEVLRLCARLIAVDPAETVAGHCGAVRYGRARYGGEVT